MAGGAGRRASPNPRVDPDGYARWKAARARIHWLMSCSPQSEAGPCDSSSEERLRLALQHARVQVFRQQVLANRFGRQFAYRADLAYYDPRFGLRLDIEVDGT